MSVPSITTAANKRAKSERDSDEDPQPRQISLVAYDLQERELRPLHCGHQLRKRIALTCTWATQTCTWAQLPEPSAASHQEIERDYWVHVEEDPVYEYFSQLEPFDPITD